MTKWNKEPPKNDCWLWIKFKGKHGIVMYPAQIITWSGVHHLKSRGADFIDFNDGKGFTWNGTPDKTLRFGPLITPPS